jgi:hypothetical protein
MAILDSFSTFSGSVSAAGVISGQTVTGTDTTVLSTNTYDTTGGTGSAQAVDLGKGQPFDIDAFILTAFSGGTSVEVQFVSADNAALSTNLTVIASSGAIAIASLTAGKKITLDVGKADPRTIRRYVGLRYVTVGAVAAGAVFAGFTAGSADLPQPAYASGFTLS